MTGAVGLLSLAAKNVLRNKLRAVLTIVAIAVAIVAFVMLRTVLTAWTVAADYAARDRIGTRNKVTFIVPLPRRYIDDIRAMPGIKAATFMNWFGAKDPRHEHEFFGNMAVDTATFLTVYDELKLPKEQREAWIGDRKGAIVGEVLARKLGWKLGDRVTLTGTIYPGDWEFQIDGIYTATRRSADRSSMYFHWNYLNDSVPERARDQIGWVTSRIDEPSRAASISQALDKLFEEKEIATLSMSERAMNLSFLGMVSAALTAINVVSVVILVIMMLILGNTIAMGARERTSEYGVMRAIGFLPSHVALSVLGEAVTIGGLGGALGLVLAYPLVERGLGRFIEENMGSYFPYFRIAESTALAAVVLALLLGVLAGVIPAYRASRLNVIDALRRVG